MKYKKQLLIVVIAIIVYMTLTFINNKIINSSDKINAFVLNKDIKIGQEISGKDVDKITISNKFDNEYVRSMEELLNMVASENLYKGQIIYKKALISKDNVLIPNETKELISLKITNADDNISFSIKKDNIVNIYYTGKYDEANQILDDMEISNIVSGGKSGYITAKILEKVKVVGVYDGYGNPINFSENNSQENRLDTIVISVDEQEAMIISSLKKYGDFTLSLVS